MKTLYICILACALYASCTLDYSRTTPSDELKEEIPNTIISNFVHTSVSNGNPVFRIQASEARSFEKQSKTVLREVYFEEYDSQREVITHGTSDKAVLFTDTENAEISGNLEFYSSKNEAWLWGNYLYWDNGKKTLTSENDELVKIKTDDGTDIEGRGFHGDLRRQEFRYSTEVKGSYESETKDEDEGKDEAKEIK
ncbi:MAG: LPS export ABC transporter periplasmic protein LptC [Spirochaetales bacterium]|nr:LPS export ABC transporter periplasmic protein LptC [Spirochaetales bacterium]